MRTSLRFLSGSVITCPTSQWVRWRRSVLRDLRLRDGGRLSRSIRAAWRTALFFPASSGPDRAALLAPHRDICVHLVWVASQLVVVVCRLKL